jgi:hypothetical protein
VQQVKLLRFLCCLGFLMGLSIKANPTEDVQNSTLVDFSAPLECVSQFESLAERIIIGEWLDSSRRKLTVVSARAPRGKVLSASCEYFEDYYKCHWGLDSYLKINLSRPAIRRRADQRLDYSLKGKVKVGVLDSEQWAYCQVQSAQPLPGSPSSTSLQEI